MTFEEMFRGWTLDKKVEWALGPNIFNLSENMRSIIVDLKDENERLKAENDEILNHCYDGVYEDNDRLERENAKLRCLALRLVKEGIADEVARLRTRLCCCSEDDYDRIKKSIKRGNRHLTYYEEAYRKAKKALTDGK